MLINNNYSNFSVDKQISKFLNNKVNTNSTEPKKSTIDVYYQNQMHNNYKLDERVLKNIISENTTSTQPDNKINLVIYYKNKQSLNLIMKNNLSPPLPPMHQTNLVYKFICPIQHCKAEYIGYTECTLSRRMAGHCQNGSILKHFKDQHDSKPNKQLLIDNSTIIAKGSNKNNLLIKEALLIQAHHPQINKQYDTFPNVLKLQVHRGCHRENFHSPSNNSLARLTSSISTPQTPNIDTPSRRHFVSPGILNRIETLQQNNRSNIDDDNIAQRRTLRSGRIYYH